MSPSLAPARSEVPPPRRESFLPRLLRTLSSVRAWPGHLRLTITTWSVVVGLAAALPVCAFLYVLYAGELQRLQSEAANVERRETEFAAEYVRWRLEAVAARMLPGQNAPADPSTPPPASHGGAAQGHSLEASTFTAAGGQAVVSVAVAAAAGAEGPREARATVRLEDLLRPPPRAAMLPRAWLIDRAGRAYAFGGPPGWGERFVEALDTSVQARGAGPGQPVRVIEGLSVAVVPDRQPGLAAETALRRRFAAAGAAALAFGVLLLLLVARRLRGQIEVVVSDAPDTGGHSIISEFEEVGRALASARENAGRAVGELERARHDALTGLPGRHLFLERAEAMLRGVRGRNGFGVAVMYLDLDGFKALNDRKGHAYGDQVLRAVAARLLECIRQADCVGRIGGDEFAICFSAPLASLPELATLAAHRIATAICNLGEGLSCSTGWAFSQSGSELPELLQQADMAMYAAKRAKKAVKAAQCA